MQRSILFAVFAAHAHAGATAAAVTPAPHPAACLLIGAVLLTLSIISRRFTKKAGLSN